MMVTQMIVGDEQLTELFFSLQFESDSEQKIYRRPLPFQTPILSRPHSHLDGYVCYGILFVNK